MTFVFPGTYNFVCKLHEKEKMQGQIVVTGGPGPAGGFQPMPDSSGRPMPDGKPLDRLNPPPPAKNGDAPIK